MDEETCPSTPRPGMSYTSDNWLMLSLTAMQARFSCISNIRVFCLKHSFLDSRGDPGYQTLWV